MFLEPAERKKYIQISGIPKGMNFNEFRGLLKKGILESSGLVDPQLDFGEPHTDEEIERISIEFPTFESAFRFLKACRSGKNFPNEVIVSFSPFRTSWSMEERRFIDSFYFLLP
jgi:hypothetical protein